MDLEKEILRICLEKGFLLDKEMLDFFSQLNDEELIKRVLRSTIL